jgi:hypothetical protein
MKCLPHASAVRIERSALRPPLHVTFLLNFFDELPRNVPVVK